MTIWKFKLQMDNPVIHPPKGSKVLCAREQREEICVWMEVPNPQAVKDTYTFEVWATGQPMKELDSPVLERRYLNSIFPRDGEYVFHIYQIVLREDL